MCCIERQGGRADVRVLGVNFDYLEGAGASRSLIARDGYRVPGACGRSAGHRRLRGGPSAADDGNYFPSRLRCITCLVGPQTAETIEASL